MIKKGEIYLTYYAKADKLENCVKVAVSRWLPKFAYFAHDFEWAKKPKTYIHINLFAPDEYTLSKYKDGDIDFEELGRVFKEYLKKELHHTSSLTRLKIEVARVRGMLDSGNNVALVCYEKDINTCHRKFLGDLFKGMGYNINEF